MSQKRINVLDDGFVDLQDVFGDELTVVNAARVSFGKQKTRLDEGDSKLLAYLIREKHWSPFRHLFFRFHLRMPEFVLRQHFKHVVGAEWTTPSQLHGWNELSGRYVELDRIHIPTIWRKQSVNCKQGSDGDMPDDVSEGLTMRYAEMSARLMDFYHELCEAGVAKEQARVILPLGVYTECIWTCSFQAVMNFLDLRLDPHAQHEIRVFAQAIEELVKERLPLLFRVWNECSSQK